MSSSSLDDGHSRPYYMVSGLFFLSLNIFCMGRRLEIQIERKGNSQDVFIFQSFQSFERWLVAWQVRIKSCCREMQKDGRLRGIQAECTIGKAILR